MSTVKDRAARDGSAPGMKEEGTHLSRTPGGDQELTDHLFWTDDLVTAHRLGVSVRSLCGVWEEPGNEVDECDLIGELMPVPRADDCRGCLRVYEADARRSWERRQ